MSYQPGSTYQQCAIVSLRCSKWHLTANECLTTCCSFKENFLHAWRGSSDSFWMVQEWKYDHRGKSDSVAMKTKQTAVCLWMRAQRKHSSDLEVDRCTAQTRGNIVTVLHSKLHSGSSPQCLPDPLFREGSQVKSVAPHWSTQAQQYLPKVNKARCEYLRDTYVQ